LLQQQTTLPASGQPQFADQLLVASLTAGRTGNPRHQSFRVGYWKVELQQSQQTWHQSPE
jgi:hypothetical protein